MAEEKLKQKILRSIGRNLLFPFLSVYIRTVKLKIINGESAKRLSEEGKNFVLAFWHGTMLMPWFINRSKNFSALVSQSKDGEILTRLLIKWKYNTVRGSSNIGGKEALELMINEAIKKKNLAITPDGPTGPVRKMKAGAVVTAKKSNIPLVLLGVGYNKKYVLKSWDRFEIPKMFSKSVLIFSDPIWVDNDLSYDDTSGFIEKCEKELNELQEKAFTECLN